MQCSSRNDLVCSDSRMRGVWPMCRERCEGGGRSQITQGLYKESQEFEFGSKCNDQPFQQEEMCWAKKGFLEVSLGKNESTGLIRRWEVVMVWNWGKLGRWREAGRLGIYFGNRKALVADWLAMGMTPGQVKMILRVWAEQLGRWTKYGGRTSLQERAGESFILAMLYLDIF